MEPMVVEAVRGAEVEFEPFFEAHYPTLARALLLLTGDPFEAEELAQEAFARAYERWDRIKLMDSPAGYLYRIALNLNRSRLRRVTARARRAFVPAPDPDPAAVAEARSEVLRILSELPRGQREALILVEWFGMESQEAGGVLGIEAASVRGRLHRARATIRERFGGQDE